MRSVSMGMLYALYPRQDHYLDLFADGETFNQQEKKRCCFSCDELLERLADEPSIDEYILSVNEFEEPIGPFGWCNVLTGSRYFVLIETAYWWWSLEKRRGVMVIQRAKDFCSVHGRCRGCYRGYLWYSEPGPTCTRRISSVARGPRVRDVLHALVKAGMFDTNTEYNSSLDLTSYVLEVCHRRRGQAVQPVY